MGYIGLAVPGYGIAGMKHTAQQLTWILPCGDSLDCLAQIKAHIP